jgi:hypothetical protein
MPQSPPYVAAGLPQPRLVMPWLRAATSLGFRSRSCALCNVVALASLLGPTPRCTPASSLAQRGWVLAGRRGVRYACYPRCRGLLCAGVVLLSSSLWGSLAGVVLPSSSWASLRWRGTALVVVGIPSPALFCPSPVMFCPRRHGLPCAGFVLLSSSWAFVRRCCIHVLSCGHSQDGP